MAENVLYYGDNLDVMRRHIKDETVDLVYLDPPFNSNANYNVLFAEKDGTKAASQIQAFTDTWTWDQDDEAVFAEIATNGGRVADCLKAFRTFLGECDMLAYLVMMAPRLVELRRVMNPTASIYLHCDPSGSHYLKMLMDAVFGPEHFRNEIIWKRTSSHNDSQAYGNIYDSLLFYTKGMKYKWNIQYTDYDPDYIAAEFHKDTDGRLVKYENLTGPGISKGPSGQPWRGVDPTKSGRHWAIPERVLKQFGIDDPNLNTQDKLERLLKVGRIKMNADGVPRMRGLKTYLEELPGMPLQTIWTDVLKVGNTAKERLGYPTQKPEALLERILRASSNPRDVVLDPFCGCGTTIAAAQKLDRQWIGIDITYLAITLMRERLKDTFGIDPVTRAVKTDPSSPPVVRESVEGEYLVATEAHAYTIIGEPVSLPDAERLAESDPYQFQWWALGLVGARPVEEKKGSDKGIDGRIIFQGDKTGDFESVILSVKAGHTGAAHVRDLKGVLEREKAAIGVLISIQEPTDPMKTEAVTAGFFESATWGQKYPKIQLLTVAELLTGKKVEMPPIRQVGATFKKAPKVTKQGAEQQELQV